MDLLISVKSIDLKYLKKLRICVHSKRCFGNEAALKGSIQIDNIYTLFLNLLY